MVRSISSVSENFGASDADLPSPVARPIVRMLIISDDEQHRGLLRSEACNDGLDTRVAPDANRAIEAHQTDWTPDAIVVDQLMPRAEHYAVVRALRSAFAVPVFVVSDMPGSATFPFDHGVFFISRLAVIAEIRHLNTLAARDVDRIIAGLLQLDTRKSQAIIHDRVIDLTRDESATLAVLMLNIGESVTRRTLVASIGGVQRDLDPRIIDIHVVRLMVKFGPTSQVRIERTPDREGYLLRTSATNAFER
jgi:DNA-binding response OmpR family regulator